MAEIVLNGHSPPPVFWQAPLTTALIIMPQKKFMPQDEPSQQEKKDIQLSLMKQQVSIEHCQHVLSVLNDLP
jgi:hypothetical protein